MRDVNQLRNEVAAARQQLEEAEAALAAAHHESPDRPAMSMDDAIRNYPTSTRHGRIQMSWTDRKET